MKLAISASDPILGKLSVDEVQICPQNFGLIDEEYLFDLMSSFPETRFRLHANVHVLPRRIISDFSRFHVDTEYWKQLAAMSNYIKAPAYSAHAGRRTECSMEQMYDNVRAAADLFECPVAVEGHYPTDGDDFLLSNWEEYALLLEEGVPYALDLSHLNILARWLKSYPASLVKELISNPLCIEVHVSGNDGRRDSHQAITSYPVWWKELEATHDQAVIFSEGTTSAAATVRRNSMNRKVSP